MQLRASNRNNFDQITNNNPNSNSEDNALTDPLLNILNNGDENVESAHNSDIDQRSTDNDDQKIEQIVNEYKEKRELVLQDWRCVGPEEKSCPNRN